MKLTQMPTGAAAAGAIVLTAGTVSAIASTPTFPLSFKSISGRLTTTAYYGLFDQNGKFYQIGIFGSGTLSVSRNQDGIATMTFSVQGGDAFGEYQDSDSGVCTGSWAFKRHRLSARRRNALFGLAVQPPHHLT